MAKIKKNTTKIKQTCTNCFKTNHIVFNFAYVVYDENFENTDKIALINRIREVSSVIYLEVMRWDRYKGFEEERLDIRKEIPKGFNDDIEKFDGKYSVMRLYKNNVPTPRKNNRKTNK